MPRENLRDTSVPSIDVLHVDDDASVLDLTEDFLSRELDAATITTATGPEAALERLAADTYHCLVSDYDMPERDGLDLLADVRERYPDLPFILYTGKGSEEIAAEAINAGVTGYLQKGGPDQLRWLANRIGHAANEYRRQIESERYSTVLRALDYPVYVVDEHAEFEYVNDAFLELIGYEREEVIGSPPGLIKTEDDVETANGHLADIVSSEGPDKRTFRVDIITDDGDVVPCYDHMAALPFGDAFRGSVGILRDATTEIRQRERLLQQNERLEEFTSIVSHDLRTPLGNAETAAELARTSDKAEYFEQLEAAHDRMEAMIEDLLTLARDGQAVSETEPVDVAGLASEAWETFRTDDDALEVPEDALVVEGHRSRLRQLIENLLRNAVEHGSSPVTVTLGRCAGGFYVEDDGPGIDPEDREDVFEPGYTTSEDGTGFGLAIVNRIADAHGWDVAVTDSDGGGARFEFRTDPETTDTPEAASAA